MSNINKNIKVRLVMLDKTQEDLRKALAERGYDVPFRSLSKWILGLHAPSNPSIMVEIDLIITKWERAQNTLDNKNKGAN